MAKNLANMTHVERMDALMRDLKSSTATNCTAKVDKVLEIMSAEWLDVLDLRNMAIRRDGGAVSAPPAMPGIPGAASAPAALPPLKREDGFVGTIGSLIGRYRKLERSPYSKLKYKTREHYDALLDRLLKDCGLMNLAALNKEDIDRLYDGWNAGGTTAIAHSLFSILRILVNFGAAELEDRECQRLSGVMRRTRTPVLKRRVERLTREQVSEIINKAHFIGRHSVALAQAFQFECMLWQKDVIGEWVPQSEPGVSDVTYGPDKWLRGIRWSSIDKDLVLRHVSVKDGKNLEMKLTDRPLIMAELDRLGERPTAGPIVVSESAGRPYTAAEFRRQWRKAATLAGVPKHVKNMDSRGRIGGDESDEADAENDQPAESDLLSAG
jgi:hypothetical protein